MQDEAADKMKEQRDKATEILFNLKETRCLLNICKDFRWVIDFGLHKLEKRVKLA